MPGKLVTPPRPGPYIGFKNSKVSFGTQSLTVEQLFETCGPLASLWPWLFETPTVICFWNNEGGQNHGMSEY